MKEVFQGELCFGETVRQKHTERQEHEQLAAAANYGGEGLM